MSGRIEVTLQPGRRTEARGGKARSQDLLRILVMGDFSGRGADQAAEHPEGAMRSPRRLDVDNLDDVLGALSPRIVLSSAGDRGVEDLTIHFTRLDDFHPDALYERLPVFCRLRDLRARLLDPATFARAAAELREEVGVSMPTPASQPTSGAGPATHENDAATVERLLGKRPEHVQVPERRPEVTELLRRAVAPHLSPETPHQELYVRTLDDIAGARMRSILRHPGFQALERAWRSAHALVSRLETGEALEVWLLDLGRAALQADLGASGDDLSSTQLGRTLRDAGLGIPDGPSWGLLVGDFTFGTSAEDVSCLTALGGIASSIGAPFLAAADPAVLGCASLAGAPSAADWTPLDSSAEGRWQGLRRHPVARWIGLALPRVLLRLPYGEATDPIDSFDFEELYPLREHSGYLWGNPAFLCAALIGQAFIGDGWAMRPGDLVEMDDLPAHVYTQDGEPRLQSAAEGYLSESVAESIASRGVMPLLSYRNRGAVRVWQFRSLADPPVGLAGPWN
jgi:type VI secretion system protein ImpC